MGHCYSRHQTQGQVEATHKELGKELDDKKRDEFS